MDALPPPTPAPGPHYYLYQHLAGAEAQKAAQEPEPFGPGFTAAEAAEAETLEVWATTIKHAGPDESIWRLVKNGTIQHTRTTPGY